MFGLGLTFLLNAFCAINENICIPHNSPPKPEPASIYIQNLREPQVPTLNSHRLPIVETKYGLIEGYFMKTVRSRTIVAFEGMRYALPPVGNLRFRSPVPITKAWSGIQSAKRIWNSCVQMDATQYYRIYGKEDCLFINVYTPALPDRRDFETTSHEKEESSKNKSEAAGLPVVFYIHGGGHFFGTSELYGPSYLLDTQNVVLVTFNYRLGVLGYLSTGDSASPGNYALKDQALALEWVVQNIQVFGGDPSRITLWGQSAGAATVGLHLLSHKTRHIAVGAIMHSGDPLAVWAIRNLTYDSTKSIAKGFRCPMDDNFRLVSCLRRVDVNMLVGKQLSLFKRLTFPLMTFGPVIEQPHSDAFLIESPEMAYARGNVSKVPVIKGHLPNEGDFVAAIGYLLNFYPALNKGYDSIIPIGLEFENEEPDRIKHILQTLDSFYYANGEPFTFWTRGYLSQLMGDRFFSNPARKGLEWHSKTGAPTYGFLFDYKGRHSSLEALALNAHEWGISHIDDMQFLLNSTLYFKALRTTDVDFPMMEFCTNIWGNFIKRQVPVYTNEDGEDIDFWSPVDADQSDPPTVIHLNRLLGKSKMIIYPYEKRYQLWKNLNLKNDIQVEVKETG